MAVLSTLVTQHAPAAAGRAPLPVPTTAANDEPRGS